MDFIFFHKTCYGTLYTLYKMIVVKLYVLKLYVFLKNMFM